MSEPDQRYAKFTSQEIRTAYHEAGHAVVCLVLGLRIERVTIVPDDESFGSTYYRKSSKNTRDIEEVILSCAGSVGEILLLHHPGEIQALTLELFQDIVGREVFNSVSKMELEDQRAFECWNIARDIIASCAGAVMTIADALLARKILSGDEVQSLWEASTQET